MIVEKKAKDLKNSDYIVNIGRVENIKPGYTDKSINVFYNDSGEPLIFLKNEIVYVKVSVTKKEYTYLISYNARTKYGWALNGNVTYTTKNNPLNSMDIDKIRFEIMNSSENIDDTDGIIIISIYSM